MCFFRWNRWSSARDIIELGAVDFHELRMSSSRSWPSPISFGSLSIAGRIRCRGPCRIGARTQRKKEYPYGLVFFHWLSKMLQMGTKNYRKCTIYLKHADGGNLLWFRWFSAGLGCFFVVSPSPTIVGIALFRTRAGLAKKLDKKTRISDLFPFYIDMNASAQHINYCAHNENHFVDCIIRELRSQSGVVASICQSLYRIAGP